MSLYILNCLKFCKIVMDSMSINFIDSEVTQMKYIIEYY